MTATTKEQREKLRAGALKSRKDGFATYTRRLPVEQWLSILGAADERDRLAERLAAIEAVTGEEVRELVGYLTPDERLGDDAMLMACCEKLRGAATALLSLSAKVAELEAENETFVHLRGELEALSSWQMRADEAEAKVAEQAEEIGRLDRRVGQLVEDEALSNAYGDCVSNQRDTLSRLLTETAVPALDECKRISYTLRDCGLPADGVTAVAGTAISTIRAQMEGGNG